MTLLTWETTGATWILIFPPLLASVIVASIAVGVMIGRASVKKRLRSGRRIYPPQDRRYGA